METWAIVAIVVAVAVVAALAGGWLRKLQMRSPGHELNVEAPPSGRLKMRRSLFRRSKVKNRGADVAIDETKSYDSKFDVR